MTRSTMFTNNFCACQSFPFTNIWLICSVLVEFRTSFFQVSTCFNGCVAAMNARLGFGTRLRWFCDRGVWWKRTFYGSFGLRKQCGLTWLGCPMWTVIRVTPTALLLRCPWQQRFFDIQKSALSFVFSISLKKRMPVIPFPSERVFNRPCPPTFALWRKRQKLRYWVGFFGLLSLPLKTALGTSGNCRLRLHGLTFLCIHGQDKMLLFRNVYFSMFSYVW